MMVTVEQLNAVAPDAADQVAILRANAASRIPKEQNEKPTEQYIGYLASELGKAAGGTQNRHVFVETVFGIEGGSLKEITLAQANVLNFWLKEGGAEKVPIVVNGALRAVGQTDMFNGDPLASGKRKMDELLEQHKEDATMGIHYPDTTRVINQAGQMGYDGAGDVLEALGVEDFGAYEGTPEDALKQLRAAMDAQPAPEPKPAQDVLQDAAQETEPGPDAEDVKEQAKVLRAVRDNGLPLPEAPASLNFFGVTQKGWNVQFTLRDFDEDALLQRFGAMMTTLEKYKVMPCNRYGDPVVGAEARPKAQAQKSAGPAPPPPTPSTSQGDNGYTDIRTSELLQMAVKPDGVYEFEVDGMQYPLKDHRGAEVVAKLFAGCWEPGYAEPGFYKPDVNVTYGKKRKGERTYWDVLKVEPK